MSRFDHSNLSSFDPTGINTDRYKMEYIVHFEGAARSGDLPLLTFGRNDDVNCGNHACVVDNVSTDSFYVELLRLTGRTLTNDLS